MSGIVFFFYKKNWTEYKKVKKKTKNKKKINLNVKMKINIKMKIQKKFDILGAGSYQPNLISIY